MRKKLTVATIASLPRGNYADAGFPGLNLRVGASSMTWSVYHRINGRLKQTRLGHYPQLGLGDARKAAAELTERAKAGMPPPRSALPLIRELSLGELIDKYEAHRLRKGGRGVKSLARGLRIVRNDLKPYLDRPASAFSKHDLRSARDTVAARAPTLSNRLLGYWSPVARWAAAEDLVEHDFSRSVIRVGIERKRDRVLSAAEIKSIWHACDDLGGTLEARSYARLVKFLLLVGCRRGEAAGLRHGQILDNTWRLAAADTKSGRAQVTPLSSLAMRIVGSGEARGYVFPGGSGERLLVNWTRHKNELDRLSGVRGWRVHDLRRTCASGLQDLGVDFMTVESVLGHALPGVAGIYMRSELAAAKASALGLWAAEVERIVGARRAAS